MKWRLVRGKSETESSLQVHWGEAWYVWRTLDAAEDESAALLPVLERASSSRERFESEIEGLIAKESLPVWKGESAYACLPFAPRSFRDFMLFEEHAIGAARGFVRRNYRRCLPVVRGYESLLRRPFPLLKPKPLWYQHPIYYVGNHLSFVPDGAEVELPRYSLSLDYELELGFVLVRPLKNASPQEAEDAIGAFFVLNDYSARDVQLAEMRSGFGPVKAKNFATAMSSSVVTPDEVFPWLDGLSAEVWINGELVTRSRCEGMQFSLGEAIAYASLEEQLFPGEVMGTGTLPGCSGIESGRELVPGDRIELRLDRVGRVAGTISRGEASKRIQDH